MVVGTTFPSVHVDPRDGLGYLPGTPAMLLDDNEMWFMNFDHAGSAGATKAAEIRGYGLDTVEKRGAKSLALAEAALHAELEQRRNLSEYGHRVSTFKNTLNEKGL